jgi:hypothetical protein
MAEAQCGMHIDEIKNDTLLTKSWEYLMDRLSGLKRHLVEKLDIKYSELWTASLNKRQ